MLWRLHSKIYKHADRTGARFLPLLITFFLAVSNVHWWPDQETLVRQGNRLIDTRSDNPLYTGSFS